MNIISNIFQCHFYLTMNTQSQSLSPLFHLRQREYKYKHSLFEGSSKKGRVYKERSL